MALTEDLSVFFDPALFGVIATFSFGTVNGIFDGEFSEAIGIVESTNPMFTCASADITAVTNGDTVTINATTYIVRSIQPDATGVSVIELQSQ